MTDFHKASDIQSLVDLMIDHMREQIENPLLINAGINLTGYHPPGHPGAFAPKCVPSPRAFAQQKMPGGWANKFQTSLRPGICINMKIVDIVICA